MQSSANERRRDNTWRTLLLCFVFCVALVGIIAAALLLPNSGATVLTRDLISDDDDLGEALITTCDDDDAIVCPVYDEDPCVEFRCQKSEFGKECVLMGIESCTRAPTAAPTDAPTPSPTVKPIRDCTPQEVIDNCGETTTCMLRDCVFVENLAKFLCSEQDQNEGSACDDGDAFTVRDECREGVCRGTPSVLRFDECEGQEILDADCDPNQCHEAICEVPVTQDDAGDVRGAPQCRYQPQDFEGGADRSCNDGDPDTHEDMCTDGGECRGLLTEEYVRECTAAENTCQPVDCRTPVCHVYDLEDDGANGSNGTVVCLSSPDPSAENNECGVFIAQNLYGRCDAQGNCLYPSTIECNISPQFACPPRECHTSVCAIRAVPVNMVFSHPVFPLCTYTPVPDNALCDNDNGVCIDGACQRDHVRPCSVANNETCPLSTNPCATTVCTMHVDELPGGPFVSGPICTLRPFNAGSACDDQNPFTDNDQCTADGECRGDVVSGAVRACDAVEETTCPERPCAARRCLVTLTGTNNGTMSCFYENDNEVGPCEDGLPATGDGICVKGHCVPTELQNTFSCSEQEIIDNCNAPHYAVHACRELDCLRIVTNVGDELFSCFDRALEDTNGEQCDTGDVSSPQGTCWNGECMQWTPPPTESPTLSPTLSPTASPTQAPSVSPTESPTLSPTLAPTIAPTPSPTITLLQCSCDECAASDFVTVAEFSLNASLAPLDNCVRNDGVVSAGLINLGGGNDCLVNFGTISVDIQGAGDSDCIVNYGTIEGLISTDAASDCYVNYGNHTQAGPSAAYVGGDNVDRVLNLGFIGTSGGLGNAQFNGNGGDDFFCGDVSDPSSFFNIDLNGFGTDTLCSTIGFCNQLNYTNPSI